MDKTMGERQRWLWLLSALTVVVAVRGCGLGWLWVLAGCIPAVGYYIYMDKKTDSDGIGKLLTVKWGVGGKVLAVICLAWTVLAMGWTADLADGAFPMVNGFPVLGWIMLALAGWGSFKGPAACARCAGILCVFLLALYGAVVAFAIPDVQINHLIPRGNWLSGVEALGLCLLPACIWFLPGAKGKAETSWAWALPLVAVVLPAVTAGVLSPTLAEALPAPLYTLGQSVSLFGVLERIEPLLSVAMTMGVFCLLSAMACACRVLADNLRPCPWSGIVACVVAGGLMGVVRGVPATLLTASAVVFWVVLPLVTLWRKKTAQN